MIMGMQFSDMSTIAYNHTIICNEDGGNLGFLHSSYKSINIFETQQSNINSIVD